MGRKKYELCCLCVTTSFPPGCLWKRASQIALSGRLEEQAVPRMEAWSSFQRCHLNPHVWDLPYIWFNSHRILSPASSPGVPCAFVPAAQPEAQGRGWLPNLGNHSLEILPTLLYSPWWSRAPCSCAITIPHGSISHYGVVLSYIFISINVLPVFSPLQYQAVMRPSGFAHFAGVCSLLYLLALLPWAGLTLAPYPPLPCPDYLPGKL